MRKFLNLLLILGLASCQTLPALQATSLPAAPPTATAPQLSTAPAVQEPSGFSLLVMPEDALYVGDLVSFIVLPSGESASTPGDVSVSVAGETFGPEEFKPFGIGNHLRATLRWVWDTSAYPPGDYIVTLSVSPDDPQWQETVTLLPAEQEPAWQTAAEWQTVSNECCEITYLSGTQAAADISMILALSKQAADGVSAQLGGELSEPVRIVLLPRVLGHGGFAAYEIYVSYLPRNYAGDDLGQILNHEIAHLLDGRIGGDLRPTFFIEGLAVYLSGGHFKREPLRSRAATLVGQGLYIPLEDLIPNFYNEQHEIGYLEAGALIEYMAARWGYPAFDAFYRDLHSQPGGDMAAIQDGLQRHFGIDLAELEADFLADLRMRPVIPDLAEDTRLTVRFFDAVRAYQQALDPQAYFLSAWLIYIGDLQAQDVVADYLRHPIELVNITLETLLISAREALEVGHYAESEHYLDAVEMALDALARGNQNPLDSHPLAAQYAGVAQAALTAGWQPATITISGNQAEVTAIDSNGNLGSLTLTWQGGDWLLAN